MGLISSSTRGPLVYQQSKSRIYGRQHLAKSYALYIEHPARTKTMAKKKNNSS